MNIEMAEPGPILLGHPLPLVAQATAGGSQLLQVGVWEARPMLGKHQQR